jgi:hypothetical protein
VKITIESTPVRPRQGARAFKSTDVRGLRHMAHRRNPAHGRSAMRHCAVAPVLCIECRG